MKIKQKLEILENVSTNKTNVNATTNTCSSTCFSIAEPEKKSVFFPNVSWYTYQYVVIGMLFDVSLMFAFFLSYSILRCLLFVVDPLEAQAFVFVFFLCCCCYEKYNPSICFKRVCLVIRSLQQINGCLYAYTYMCMIVWFLQRYECFFRNCSTWSLKYICTIK